MDKNIVVIFFDLFFTLITPKYNELRNENDVLKITKEEWELYAEENELYEKRDDCDEVIIIKNEIVTDTTIANIAIFYENSWITSKNCLLGGTTRARLLEEKKLFEKDITLDMLKNASKVALMNAMIGFDEIKDFKIKEEI